MNTNSKLTQYSTDTNNQIPFIMMVLGFGGSRTVKELRREIQCRFS